MFLSLTALRSKLNTEVVAIGDSMQPQTRAALLVFVLLPIALVGAMLPLSARLQATVLRVLLLARHHVVAISFNP
jgi:hypothetical protein